MTGLIVHEWLEPLGGAETVVERMAMLFPDAPIYALWNDAPERFPSDRVSQSWLARTPLRRHKALALPLMPATWRLAGRRDADWLLCSSHLFAHHARFGGPAKNAPKYVYAYTPARYVWDAELDERGSGMSARLASPLLRRIDKRRSREARAIAAISHTIRARIERAWDREAEVIYPPVDVARFTAGPPQLSEEDQRVIDALPETFLLGASRFVRYKRLDLVIQAGAAADIAVVLAGTGPDEEALRSTAAASGASVHFVLRPSDGLLHALYRRAVAFVFPAVEDFGIMPVEAMAAGTPVIGRAAGGVSETVADGVSGVLLEDFGTTAIRDAIDRSTRLDTASIVERALTFDAPRFDAQLTQWMARHD